MIPGRRSGCWVRAGPGRTFVCAQARALGSHVPYRACTHGGPTDGETRGHKTSGASCIRLRGVWVVVDGSMRVGWARIGNGKEEERRREKKGEWVISLFFIGGRAKSQWNVLRTKHLGPFSTTCVFRATVMGGERQKQAMK